MLQGSLDSFGFEEVAMFLAATQKTGRLDLDGDRGSGSLWFVDGDVVAAVAAGVAAPAEVADAMFELLRCSSGAFAFIADEAAPAPGPAHEVASLLEQVGLALVEWHELAAIVPADDLRLSLVSEPPVDPVVLDAGQWRLVVALGPGATVADLSPVLGGELAVLRLVRDLVAAGLVEIGPAPAAILSPPVEPADLRLAAPPVGSDGTDHADPAGGGVPAAGQFDDGVLLSPRRDER